MFLSSNDDTKALEYIDMIFSIENDHEKQIPTSMKLAYFIRGFLFRNQELHKELKVFDSCVKIEGDFLHKEAYCFRGYTLMDLKQYQNAMECFDIALKDNTLHIEMVEVEKFIGTVQILVMKGLMSLTNVVNAFYVIRCRKFVLLSKVEALKKLEEWERALSILTRRDHCGSDNDIFCVISRAEILMVLKKFKEALTFINRALRLSPHNVICLNNKGVILVKLGKKKSAEVFFDRLLEQNDQYRFYWYFRKGVAMMILNNNEEALYCFNEVISEDPNHYLSHMFRG